MNEKIIFLEFNELCPDILEKWMAQGKLPNFKRLYDRSKIYITESDETDPVNLEPWIQWYSMHTGLPFKEHKVFHLTDGPRAGHDDVWQILLRHGKTVWNCSSMNAKGLSQPGAMFVPDPWCTSEAPYPAELSVFHNFVAARVQEYSNPNNKPTLGEIAELAAFLFTHGVGAGSVAAIVRQLTSEFLSKGASGWQRVAILDKLLADVFKHYWKQARPDFSTIFMNSVAHLQHSYWRHMDPDAFTVKPSEQEMAVYRNAIEFGYCKIDERVGELLDFAHANGAKLMFATALSQQPFLKYEATGGQHFYRPRYIEKLLAELDIHPQSLFPVMTHQYQAIFASEADREAAQRKLESLYLGDRAVFDMHSKQPNDLYFGSQINREVPGDAKIHFRGGRNDEVPFLDWFYKIEAIKSGRHHPDGCFWVETGEHQVVPGKVSILDVLPTVLAHFGIAQPVVAAGRNLLAA